MSRTLSLRNRQRVRRVNTSLLRRVTLQLLSEQFHVADFGIAIHLVTADEMSRMNWTFLQHEGSTDVITFDHSSEPASLKQPATGLHGEIFICIDDAVKQAREFRTTWQAELMRYVIHGLLHLRGHDDLKPSARRIMKADENRLLRETSHSFPLAELDRDWRKPILISSHKSKRSSRSTA